VELHYKYKQLATGLADRQRMGMENQLSIELELTASIYQLLSSVYQLLDYHSNYNEQKRKIPSWKSSEKKKLKTDEEKLHRFKERGLEDIVQAC
jgi:hypothetical protein